MKMDKITEPACAQLNKEMQEALDAVAEKHGIKISIGPGRYDDQLAQLARIIRGEEPNRFPPSHDLAVHETVLRASDMPLD